MRRAIARALFLFEIGLASGPTLGQAQDFYGGVGFDHALSAEGGGGLVGFAGVRFGEGALSFGAELGRSFGSDQPYGATRLRGMVRSELGGISYFGSFGVTQFDLFAGGVVEGLNLGLGADYGLTDHTVLRFEMIVDHVPDHGADVASLRLGVAFGF